MRNRSAQTAHFAYLAILGVLLMISFIGYLCAENVAPTGFISSEMTIQRLPPVENAATYPPYGFQGYGRGTYQGTHQEKFQAPTLAPPTNQRGGPILQAPSPGPQVSIETGNGADATKEEEEPLEDIGTGMSTGPLGLITVSEDLAWINEVRPDSMLVRMTRYLSQYVGKWDGSIQLGLDGTSGSSETFNAAFGVDGKRKFELATFQFDIDYKRSTAEGAITADRLFFTCRYECPCNNDGLNFFVQDEVTYDEFQPWNVQVAVSSGVGYYLWKKETSQMQALWGGGFSQDVGGPDDECVPEMHLGLNGEHRINKRQKLVASCSYFPNATDFAKSRIISKASWEVLLDDEVNLSMKFNVTDRLYTPNPGGQPNDLDYSVLLMWKF